LNIYQVKTVIKRKSFLKKQSIEKARNDFLAFFCYFYATFLLEGATTLYAKRLL